MKQAIIDIGSNSIRLTLYETEGQSFKVLFREKIMAGLAGYVEDGKLSAEGIECACAGLLTFRKILQTLQIENTRIFATASLRNVSTLVSRDLDGDGIVEIPTQPDEAGLLNLSQSRRMDFIVWMDYTSPEPEKSFGLLDEESSCYIELPAEWEGNLMLTDSTEGEEAVELHTVDEGKLVLTMRLVPSSESAAGWTRLGVVASRQMQAKFGPDVVLKDQSYRLSRSLYRLN